MIEELYEFNLTDEQEKRAKELLSSNINIDMLFQGPIGTYSIPEDIDQELYNMALSKYPNNPISRIEFASEQINRWSIRGKLEELYKECWYDSGLTVGCRQLGISSERSLLSSMARVQLEFDSKPWLIKARNAEDIRSAHRQGLKAGIVTSQESAGFGKDLKLLESAYDFGLRNCQLSYNNQNLIGAGCMESSNAGLSVFGREYIKELNNLGIIVDTGHSGKQTTLDACSISNSPVIASHTGVEEIYRHNRCKSDDEIKAIADTGGVIGMYAMPWFIHEDPNNTTIEHFIDHISYVAELVGIDHVGIGTDWPMPQTTWMATEFKEHIAHTLGFAKGDGPSTEWVKGLKDYRSNINIVRGLMARGFSDEDICKIMGLNWLRVIEEICK